MTAVGQLVQRSRFLLFGGSRDAINFLAADPTTGPTLELANDTSGIAVGDYLESAFETMRVSAISGTTVTVHRGIEGVTNTTIPVGTTVRIRPVTTDYALFLHMVDELADLSSPLNGLYQVKTTDITVIGNVSNGYDLPIPDATLLIRARASDMTQTWGRAYGVRLERGVADFPSGVAVFLSAYTGRTLRVWVRCPFTPLAIAATVESTGLDPNAFDILCIGAAYRFAIGRELVRSQFEFQGDTRRAGEVPPGAQRQGLTPFVALRATRIAAEKARLDQLWKVERD